MIWAIPIYASTNVKEDINDYHKSGMRDGNANTALHLTIDHKPMMIWGMARTLGPSGPPATPSGPSISSANTNPG